MKVAILVGSNRRYSVSRKVAHWLAPILQMKGLDAEVLDLAEINLPWLDEPELPALGMYQVEATKTWSSMIQEFDALVIVFPQYNWGYPAVLKNALDTLYQEWQGMPVATVAIGSHGGFQGELALSLVLQGLKMKRLSVNLKLTMKPDEISREAEKAATAAFLAPYLDQVDLLARDLKAEGGVE
ncbi:NAD(P)H-dependent oxidoreductase [Fructobacillus sp. M1-13]|uniref:NAD(P)H-dependent oxidoreductase n=1 Tax=Fructobacillus papyriferae TaxID=2713171 RepID=A0ABS5QPV7_9LACO|nr:NAD(P)H-dependent oxidoreductase [Fructobacillus papyriferae]MBS9335214.1 NAD(P)H-dependent oxidoreductase [Fructobacillus papyriferae]MCD2159117.1 NAD(P)H-dependent oxidoreductase [Fructobacillus papyriferae]